MITSFLILMFSIIIAILILGKVLLQWKN